jgi:hypothetical protein
MALEVRKGRSVDAGFGLSKKPNEGALQIMELLFLYFSNCFSMT